MMMEDKVGPYTPSFMSCHLPVFGWPTFSCLLLLAVVLSFRSNSESRLIADLVCVKIHGVRNSGPKSDSVTENTTHAYKTHTGELG